MALFNDCLQFSTIEVEGTLRAPLSADLRHSVETLLRRGHRCILLNLARLSDIDAAGIGELLHAYERTKPREEFCEFRTRAATSASFST